MKTWLWNALRVVVLSVPLYLFWWMLACAFVTWEWNPDRQLEYFKMAWGSQAGEKPAVAWWLSLFGFFVSGGSLLAFRSYLRKFRGPKEWQ
jgi:hypothetical protein